MQRQRKLKAWMAENDLTFKAIGKKAGCSAQHACQALRREVMSQATAARFIGIGIPLELLPKIVDIPLGPRTKKGTLGKAEAEASSD